MIPVVLYQIFVIWLARKNASWSNPADVHKIKHTLNGLCHLAAAGIVWYFFTWTLAVSLLLITRVVFDATYNMAMDNGLGYIPQKPKSRLDQLEKLFFKINKLEEWFILLIVKIICRRKTVIPDYVVERVAIVFRLKVLSTGIILLFI
jgi:hypothetical protein